MRESIAFACFVAGTACFVRFFYLSFKLKEERTAPATSKLQDWFPWLPGTFSPAGMRIRRQMNAMLAVGWVLLVVGLVLSPR